MKKLSATLLVSTSALLLAACSPSAPAIPATPQAAKAQIESLGKTVLEQKEALTDKAEATKDALESLGNKVQATANTVTTGLETVGNTVLEATGQEPEKKQP